MIEVGNIAHTPSEYIIKIMDVAGAQKAKVAMGSDMKHSKELMGKDEINLTFVLPTLERFKRGDYLIYDGAKYTIVEDYMPSEEQDKYELTFQAEYLLLKNALYFYTRQGFNELEFSLTSNAKAFMQIAVDNANRYFGTDEWSVGECPDTEIKPLSFEGQNVIGALSVIAEAFEMEWEVKDKQISLIKRVEMGEAVTFECGETIAKAERKEGDTDEKYNRIIPLGSERNLPPNYRKPTEGEMIDGIVQKRLRIPIDKGDYIDLKPNMKPSEVVEGSVIFDDIYPHRVGVTEDVFVRTYNEKNEETGEIEEWNAYCFTDSDKDFKFKEEYILPNVELQLTFQSGRLNGMTFGVIFHENGVPKDDFPKEQTFELVRADTYGMPLPNDTLKPEKGDEYVLFGFDIALVGEQYLTTAEETLYDKAVEWLENKAKDIDIYDCQSLIKHFHDKKWNFDIGQRVLLINPMLEGGERRSRVTGFEKSLINPYDALYRVGDAAEFSRIRTMEKEIGMLKGTADQADKSISRLQRKQSDTSEDLKKIKSGQNSAGQEIAELKESQYSAGQEIGDLRDNQQIIIQNIGDLIESVNALSHIVQEIADSQNAMIDKVNGIASEQEQMKKDIEGLKKEQP